MYFPNTMLQRIFCIPFKFRSKCRAKGFTSFNSWWKPKIWHKKILLNAKPPDKQFCRKKKLIHKVNNIMLGTIECPSSPTPCSSTTSCSTTTPILPGHPRPLAPFLRNSLHWDPIELWIPILQLSNLQLTIRKRPHGQVHNSFLQDTICT